jgi:cytidine deaminase
MKHITHQLTIDVFDREDSLAEPDRKLVSAAVEAVYSAYAPYSGFRVGSAVLLANGEIITGCNQENAVFPLGLCAERVALFSAGSRFPDVPVIALALATEKVLKKGEMPVFPCGSCRQVMVEFESRHRQPIRLLVHGSDGKTYVTGNTHDILPFAMTGETLG